MVRDSLEAHKDRHAPLLRRFGAALLWRFVVGEAAGALVPSVRVVHRAVERAGGWAVMHLHMRVEADWCGRLQTLTR